MKRLFILLILILITFFFWPAQPDSHLHSVREQFYNQCDSIFKGMVEIPLSDEERAELLARKKEELKAFEDGLAKVNADLARAQSEVPVCPQTGQQSKLRVMSDTRPEAVAHIDRLKEEIRELEADL
jgi:hypothetical protein